MYGRTLATAPLMHQRWRMRVEQALRHGRRHGLSVPLGGQRKVVKARKKVAVARVQAAASPRKKGIQGKMERQWSRSACFRTRSTEIEHFMQRHFLAFEQLQGSMALRRSAAPRPQAVRGAGEYARGASVGVLRERRQRHAAFLWQASNPSIERTS